MADPSRAHVTPSWQHHVIGIDCWCRPGMTHRDKAGEVWIHRLSPTDQLEYPEDDDPATGMGPMVGWNSTME